MLLKEPVHIKDNLAKVRDSAGFIALFLFFAGSALWWLHLDRMPPAWDDSWYLANSLTLYDALVTRGILGFIGQFYTVLGFKAPLIAALPAPFYLVGGRNWHLAYLVNIGAMLLLFASVYSIGKRVANRSTGLFAVAVVGTMPLLYGLADWYLVEYTLTALVAAALWLLLLSRNLEDRARTFALGLVCGAGLLLKASFPVFVAVPIAIALYRSTRRVAALVFLAVPCVAIALPWYALHWKATLNNALDAAYGATSTQAQGTGSVFSFPAIAGYFNVVAQDGVSLYYVALGAVLIVAQLSRRDRETFHKVAGICGPWIAPLVLFVFAGNKDIRYAAPLYPAFGLALAIAIDGLLARRRWMACLLMIAPVVAMVATNFAWPYAGADHRYARRYNSSAWPQEGIAKLISEAGPLPKNARFLVGSDRERFNANNFELAIRELGLPLTVESTAYDRDINVLLRAVDSATYFAYKEGGELESPFFNVRYGEIVEHVKHSIGVEEIHLPRELALVPDGGVARLFHVKRRVLTTALPPLPELHADLSGLMELAGLEIHRTTDAIEVTYGWRCLKPIDREYWCFTHITDEHGVIIGQLDHRIAGGDPPVTAWRPGEAAAETFRFVFPNPKAASKVKLRIGLYDVPSDQRLRITLPSGSKAALADDGTALVVEP